MDVIGGLRVARHIAALSTSRTSLEKNAARTAELSRRFTPEIPGQRREPHPLKLALARALAPRNTLPQAEPSKLAVTRMAAILKAANENRGRPLRDMLRKRN